MELRVARDLSSLNENIVLSNKMLANIRIDVKEESRRLVTDHHTFSPAGLC